MGSNLEAFISAKADVLEFAAARFASRCIALPQSLFLLPLPEGALADDRTVARLGFHDLSSDLTKWAEQASADVRIGYLENQTFAGEGIAGACIWERHELVWGPRFTCDIETDAQGSYRWTPDPRDSAVNAALRELGVDRGPAVDEFAALGLHVKRH